MKQNLLILLLTTSVSYGSGNRTLHQELALQKILLLASVMQKNAQTIDWNFKEKNSDSGTFKSKFEQRLNEARKREKMRQNNLGKKSNKDKRFHKQYL